MAQITVTVPDAVAPRIQDAFVKTFNYQAEIDDPQNPGTLIPNPETPALFVRRILKEYMRSVVLDVESGAAQETARESAVNKVITDFGP